MGATTGAEGRAETGDFAKSFPEGDPGEVAVDGYTSGNTYRLDKEELRALLLALPEVRREVEDWRCQDG
jgi:hypothetical protein